MVITKDIYGEHHRDVAVTYHNLGNVYSRLGQYSEAKEHYVKALISRIEIYGIELNSLYACAATGEIWDLN